MNTKTVATYYPKTKTEWRDWLAENHLKENAIWLIQYKKGTGHPTISWDEAVEEALCFGWIDSTRRTIDDQKFMQFFGRRKANSTWSKINKEKVARLEADNLMAPAGLATVAVAQKNGSWTILDSVDALLIPEDLLVALAEYPGAKGYFFSLSKSIQKMMLLWLVLAKRPETRQKRIAEIAQKASLSQKPKHIG